MVYTQRENTTPETQHLSGGCESWCCRCPREFIILGMRGLVSVKDHEYDLHICKEVTVKSNCSMYRGWLTTKCNNNYDYLYYYE